ncbi:hypothetical protein QS306_14495 [Paraburkholderia bonniea]|uniref:hypothetical protein n=1 Tax=Paraburkholderia bonniea TaxID=2152891 RepID=UPI0025726BAC|nr:hypothetical protein [Paraburkholderia bonniea]WJF91978.1 hypothetical protein QS306_14495 [Paraburkholderia bonniea]WJF95297.1 hypothetical protein QS308_14500 [Paraburkholderia bonniea]
MRPISRIWSHFSHRSPIEALKSTATGVMKSLHISRETMVERVVEAHARIGAIERTGIEFNDHRDPVTRQKTNADRVFRWLDDAETDRNLLSVNMLPSIVAGLPVDVATEVLNEILAPAGFAVRPLRADPVEEFDPVEIVRAILSANHRTEADATALLDGIDPGEARRLYAALTESIRANTAIADALEATMRREVSA